ncbi:enolase-phosphatase E1 [Brachyistius frenatus]|uniref:enolase-phosphatase E1 n=1 Tax=Brachyistius frenatus TaxID=100188 RepID=UPI0037E80DCC
MDDFDCSVEICDRDWECFFAECEECHLLSPSLAGVDDSGMSDIDDPASILAKRAQRVDRTAGFSEIDRPIDGPPDCEGSPAEHYLSKHGISAIESVLSGSEEDIHLQSVNVFFERLKSLTEAEPSQVKWGNNSEAVQEEERCSDGQQASGSSLPKNLPKLNSLPARGEAAVGRETTKPVDTIRNINTMKKVQAESNVSSEPAAGNSELKTIKLTETELTIRGEARTETGVNEAPQPKQSHDSPDRVLFSESTPHNHCSVMSTPLDESKQESLFTYSKKCGIDLTNVKWREDQTRNISQSDTTSTNKAASQESSPSASIKRKRRKKRRLSMEPGDGGHRCERQVSVKQTDSEDEQYALRGGSGQCLSEDAKLYYLNEPQKNLAPLFTPCSVTSSFPLNRSAKEVKVNDLSTFFPPCDSQYLCLPESVVRQRGCIATGAAENNATVIPLSQTANNEMSTPNNRAHSRPRSKLQAEESAGLNKYSGFPREVVTDKSDMARENQRKEVKAGVLQQSDQINPSVIECENEQNLKCCAAEVKSVSLLPSAEEKAPAVEDGQNEKLSAAKSVLVAEAGNSGRDEQPPCQSEAEPQQQLESDCHSKDQYSTTLENTLCATGGITSHAPKTKPQKFKTAACPLLDKVSNTVICTNLPSDCIDLSQSTISLDINNTVQQTEHPLEVQTLSKLDILSEKNPKAERTQSAVSQITVLTNIPQTETKQSLSEDFLTSLSDITHVSSCYTLDTESVISLSNENFTNMSASFCSSISEDESGGQGGKKALMSAEQKEGDATSGPEGQPESNCDSLDGAEDSISASKAECEPEKVVNKVFAMSSFWSEMEKLTINDILGVRMISKGAPPSSLPPLQETEEPDMFAVTDSGFFTHVDESKSEQVNEDACSAPDSEESSLRSVIAVDSSSSRSVTWEREPFSASRCADIYPENMMLTSVTNTPQLVLSNGPQKCLRKISKNVSVHNLHALESESFGYTRKVEALHPVDESDSEKVEYFTKGFLPKQDKDMESLPSSLTDTYRVSLTDIFQYFFGGKKSAPSPAATENITTFYADGNSVPETYDHFFSEFDTESFFYPLTAAKDKPVPIFFYSRSADRNLQFPEAYEYFFASSSSDDSSVESDEEDNCGPVRVVTRFSRKTSSTQISTDIYENFFTDSDLRQNLFWKPTLSFRNSNFTASTVQKQRSNPLSLTPVRPSSRSRPRTFPALVNQDVMFPDPLLCSFDDRISRQVAQQPFRYEDLQTPISNPRLDASLLPLRHSDMCLVCIAFASWVLKTANPQVGDAWKAVLLANVSALSAIRYLRKYVKMEAAENEMRLCHTSLPDS